MKKCTIALLASALLAAVGGCDHSNSNYCAGKLNDDCRSDGGTQIKGCAAAPDKCTGATPVCDTAMDVCVACLGINKEASSCPATAPVCSSQTCGGCTADAQCDSGVCRADGTCSPENTVVYVSLQSSGTGCTSAIPCDLQTGLLQTEELRNVVHLAPGLYSVPEGISILKPTVIVGRGATISRGVMGPSVISTSALTIEFLTVTGGSGFTGLGVSTNGGSLTLNRAIVVGNVGGGVKIDGSEFNIQNSWIVANGSTGAVNSNVGGIQLLNINTAGEHVIAFNTISENSAVLNVVSGINCAVVGTPLTFSNNIIYANNIAGTATQVGGGGMCTFTFSDIGPEGSVTAPNLNVAPMFLNTAQKDFHLQAASPVKDKADPAATLRLDIDGDLRPQGAARDMGADEIK
jgi:hypothetical protein